VRIASLSPAVTEILFALGKGGEIVCVDQFSDHPEGAKDLPHLMGHTEVRAEDLRKHEPEIVLTGTAIQAKLATELRAAGFSVIHQDPRTIHQIYEAIRGLGAIFEAEREAEALVLKMQQGFNAVKKKAALLPASRSLGEVGPKRPRLYIEEWHDPPYASGNWVPEVARIAGGEQFPVPAGELSRVVTLSEVQAFDPDLIVISWCGAGSLAPKELLLKRPGWDQLRTVQQGHVRVIDDSLLNRPGPRLVEGAQRLYGWIFELLH
jgi:iron complex transport system substrate-binding protein